jgi:uncharacterized Tic20 family protein
MSDQPLDNKIRLWATACYLSGLSWFPTFYLLRIIIAGKEMYLLLCIPALAMLAATLLTAIVYLINRHSHPFLDRSGRCALNLTSSYSLYLTVVVAFLGSICGISVAINSPKSMALSAIAYLFMFPMLFFFYSCCSLAGGIHVWQGKLYSAPLTIQFLDECRYQGKIKI